MDFLKTLLLYMTVTMAVGVQEGPLPEDVPTPTAAPTAQETAAPETTELPGLQVTLPDTPTPPPEPTEVPSPTITPNKAYSTLQHGDRGNDVRKLQERLIELGYLPEGAADGAYGYQTTRAVRAFQEANGLARDGVAGIATQTHLYEDPDVIAAATAEPVATDTPEPTASPEPDTEAPAGEIGVIALPEAETAETEAPEAEAADAEEPETEVPADDEAPEAEGPEANALGLTEVGNASIVLGESGAKVTALRLSDGVMVYFNPRVWLNAEDQAVVSLRDMAEGIGSWVLQIEDNVYTLSAEEYTVELTVGEEAVTATVDGEEITLAAGDVLCDGEDVYVTEGFLRQVFKAETRWDADERTLMLNIPGKEAASSND